MITQILEGLTNLGFETALLEAFDWDEEKCDAFCEEFRYMMLAAPPNIEKALFWLRNTPWTSLNGEQLPDNVYNIIRDYILQMKDAFVDQQKAVRQRKVVELPHFRRKNNTNDPEEWN
tara:strand:+ start:42 stop:395 length:354 start_codon:yes stop_codon:yes gene_type:complete